MSEPNASGVVRNSETALRVIGALLIAAGLIVTLFALAKFSERRAIDLQSVLAVLSWTLSPVLFGFLLIKAAKALEWIWVIKQQTGSRA